MSFPAFKFLLWEFLFLFWNFVLHSSMHLALGRLKGVSVRKYHLREHKILHCTKKKVWCRRRENIRSIAKIPFCFVFHSFETFQQLWTNKKCNLLTTFTWNVSFMWFEIAEIITPKWEHYNTERNISVYCTSSTSLLMTSVNQLMEYPAFYLYSS